MIVVVEVGSIHFARVGSDSRRDCEEPAISYLDYSGKCCDECSADESPNIASIPASN